jgi:hypothetical protein
MATSTNLTGTIAANVREAMAAAGKNTNRVSQSTGIPLATLQRRLKGIETQAFKVNELELIADDLGTTITALLQKRAA